MNRPRFRTDLVTSPTSEDGNQFVDVTDPDNGKTFRFYEVEYAMASAMDGARDIRGLIAWAQEELGLAPSQDEIETVVSTLDALGYLDADSGAAAPPGSPSSAKQPDGSSLDISDLSLGAPGKSPIRADERRRSESSNVALGQAGRSPMAGGSAKRESTAPELELGAAGGTDEAPAPMTGAPTAPPMDLPDAPTPIPAPPPAFRDAVDPKRTLMGTGALNLDGHPGQRPPSAPSAPNTPKDTDLSVDLGQHINIGTDDVKEAVRASRVMSVPEMPNFGAEPVSVQPAGSKPIELPGRPPAPSMPSAPRAPVAPPPPVTSGGGSSALTIVLFVLLLAAAAGAAYYFFIYANGDSEETETKPKPTATNNTNDPEAKKTPIAPVGMVTGGQATSAVVKAPREGKLAWLVADGAVVEKDDVVAKFAGFEKDDTAIKDAETSKARYQDKLAKAMASNNKSAMRAAEENVKRKDDDIAKLQEKLDEFILKAPAAGTVSLKVENGAEIKADDELIAVASQGWPTASFTVTDSSPYKAGEKLEVAVKSDPSKTAICEIVSADKTQLKIKCPPESGLTETTALTLR